MKPKAITLAVVAVIATGLTTWPALDAARMSKVELKLAKETRNRLHGAAQRAEARLETVESNRRALQAVLDAVGKSDAKTAPAPGPNPLLSMPQPFELIS